MKVAFITGGQMRFKEKWLNNFKLIKDIDSIDLYAILQRNIDEYRQVVKNILSNLEENIKVDTNNVISAIINSKNPLVLEIGRAHV